MKWKKSPALLTKTFWTTNGHKSKKETVWRTVYTFIFFNWDGIYVIISLLNEVLAYGMNTVTLFI